MNGLAKLDALDRAIINSLQGGFPVSDRPYGDAAARLGITEETLISRLVRLVGSGTLSRFGPLYNTEAMGGGVTLAAMAVPGERLGAVANIVNGYDEVAHNYARDDHFNMWFVILAETPQRVRAVLDEIATRTGLRVYNMPKEEEYFLGLQLEV